MSTTRIAVFAGSSRRASFNRLLAAEAAEMAADAGAEVSLVELGDYPLPIYNGDLEAEHGLPENAAKLKTLFAEQHGFIICSPENNASVSSLLKNTIDWCSRKGGPPGVEPFAGKVAALLAASPGAFGGVRGLVSLRAILQPLGVTALAQQYTLSRAHEAFDADGALKDPAVQQAVQAVVKRLVAVAEACATA